MKISFSENCRRLHCIMKQVVTATYCLLLCITAFSQDAGTYYEKGLKEHHRTPNKQNMALLAEEHNQQKLIASFIKSYAKDEDSAWVMVFVLPLPEMQGPVIDSLNNITIEDSLATVEINLENGGQIVVKKLNRSQSSINKQLAALIFSVIFDRQQKDLLAKHDLEKITFMYSIERFEYKIKNKYSGNIKKILSLPMLAQDETQLLCVGIFR